VPGSSGEDVSSGKQVHKNQSSGGSVWGWGIGGGSQIRSAHKKSERSEVRAQNCPNSFKGGNEGRVQHTLTLEDQEQKQKSDKHTGHFGGSQEEEASWYVFPLGKRWRKGIAGQ